MKHFLRTLLLLTLVGYSYFVNAQTGSCTVTDLVLQNVTEDPDRPCTYTFDVAFTIERNKFIFFQSYVEANTLVPTSPNPYPDYWGCQDGVANRQGADRAPTRTTTPAVGNPLLNVVIHNTQPNNPDGAVVFEEYIPDPGVDTVGVVQNTTATKFDIPNTNLTRITITGLEITLEPALCGTPFVMVTDFFATNADRNPNNNNNSNLPIQCVSCGIRNAVGFYSVAGLVACPPQNSTVYQYNITLTNNTGTALGGTYQVYADVNDNSSYTPGVDQLISAPGTTFSILPNATTTLTGPVSTADQYNLILVTTLTSGLAVGATTITLIPVAACINLPVKMKSFTATRKNQNVELVWETASEDNNRGFYVQRNDGGNWRDLGFIASKAQNGNSSDVLSYNYTDLNNTSRGVTQYRIRQVDLDGQAKLSEIRQVRGLAQAGKVTIYPNPSSSGKVNVVFEDGKATWNVSVADMNGRTIKQYKGVSNNLLVDNLLPGMYMIRIVDAQTGTRSNEKVIINNH